jgi:hypothetical protein
MQSIRRIVISSTAGRPALGVVGKPETIHIRSSRRSAAMSPKPTSGPAGACLGPITQSCPSSDQNRCLTWRSLLTSRFVARKRIASLVRCPYFVQRQPFERLLVPSSIFPNSLLPPRQTLRRGSGGKPHLGRWTGDRKVFRAPISSLQRLSTGSSRRI